MELFHGTRGNDPKLVYEGDVGFDFRFGSGSKCKWGQANYFAVNARYSSKFSHCTSDGSKELILARVLTGYSYECQPDRSLRMPPLRDATGECSFANARYDSVTGVTHACRVPWSLLSVLLVNFSTEWLWGFI